MDSPTATLATIDDDTLIYIFAFLSVPEILSMRQTCKRVEAVSRLGIVWHRKCTTYLQDGYPFPDRSLDSMSSSELELQACRTHILANKWLTGSCKPSKRMFCASTSSAAISDIRFVPGHNGDWILTLSKGIWSVITIWDLGEDPRIVAEYSPHGVIFDGFALNSDGSSSAMVAVSVIESGQRTIQVLSLKYQDESLCFTLAVLSTVETSFRPISMHGDLLAFSDDFDETIIWNWRERTHASLRHGSRQNNRSIQVFFAHKSILVVRARSLHLFPEPTLQHAFKPPISPIAYHSFGWIDGVAVARNKKYSLPLLSPHESIRILIRSENDNAWTSYGHCLHLYTLEPNPIFAEMTTSANIDAPLSGMESLSSSEDKTSLSSRAPYIFPPKLSANVQSARGSLRCSDVALGRHGTALWIRPQDRSASGLVTDIQDISLTSYESLVAAVFPGPFNPESLDTSGGRDIRARTLWTNLLNNWTSLDYEENVGRVVLGTGFGWVTILDL